jgi:hypothetical protein
MRVMRLPVDCPASGPSFGIGQTWNQSQFDEVERLIVDVKSPLRSKCPAHGRRTGASLWERLFSASEIPLIRTREGLVLDTCKRLGYLFTMFKKDCKKYNEAEREYWAHTKARGKRRFILREMAFNIILWLGSPQLWALQTVLVPLPCGRSH